MQLSDTAKSTLPVSLTFRKRILLFVVSIFSFVLCEIRLYHILVGKFMSRKNEKTNSYVSTKRFSVASSSIVSGSICNVLIAAKHKIKKIKKIINYETFKEPRKPITYDCVVEPREVVECK